MCVNFECKDWQLSELLRAGAGGGQLSSCNFHIVPYSSEKVKTSLDITISPGWKRPGLLWCLSKSHEAFQGHDSDSYPSGKCFSQVRLAQKGIITLVEHESSLKLPWVWKQLWGLFLQDTGTRVRWRAEGGEVVAESVPEPVNCRNPVRPLS